MAGGRKKFPIDEVMEILARETVQYGVPIVTQQVQKKRDPYKVLISTIISLRTKDEVTRSASERLYALADNPKDMLKLSNEQIEQAIFPAGFFRNKAQNILDISQRLLDEFEGETPDDLDTLLTFKGVGRKTANLVLTLGFAKQGICVDTHVHRICNRWGYVETKKPDVTELRLREILPQEHWIPINDYLVTWGQNVCKPISPWCSRCALYDLCRRIGVDKSR